MLYPPFILLHCKEMNPELVQCKSAKLASIYLCYQIISRSCSLPKFPHNRELPGTGSFCYLLPSVQVQNGCLYTIAQRHCTVLCIFYLFLPLHSEFAVVSWEKRNPAFSILNSMRFYRQLIRNDQSARNPLTSQLLT